MKKLFFLILIASPFFIASCKKSNAPLNNNEFVHYTVNGTAYAFDMPVDSVFSDTIPETPSFPIGGRVYGNRIPGGSMDVVRLYYTPTGIIAGSSQPLYFFYTPQTGYYPYTTTSANPILVNISEYGTINQYISGNFTATLTGPSPTYTTYNVICDFRVRRRI